MLDIKIYSLQEAAKILQVTDRTLHNYIKDKKIKARKIGGKWKITEENLRRFINGE